MSSRNVRKGQPIVLNLDEKQQASKMTSDKPKNGPLKKKRRSQYDPKEEARLERIVFGDASDIIANLLDNDDLDASVKDEGKHDSERIAVLDVSHSDSNAPDHEEDSVTSTKKAAWTDEDDAQYSVQDALRAQNRRLPGGRPEKSYTELLEKKYKQLVGTPKWAELNRADKEIDDLDNDILKHSCHLAAPKMKKLPKTVIDIKALTHINKETHTEGPVVSSVEFHESSTVGLVAGSSGILSLFHVDGVDNSKLHTMQYKKFPISRAKFLRDGTEVLLGSKFYAYCHSYNLISGKTCKISLPNGMTNLGHYEVSPDGKLFAACGRSGEIYLLTSATKELVGTLKMNARCRALAFTPDSQRLVSHGDSNELYVWDVNSRVCVHRAVDDGCLSCSTIAIAPSGQFLATGSREGVVNLYDTNAVLERKVPVPLKIVMNLVTSISALKFNPHSEILAMASNKKPNAFKMLHLPSFSVFSNFPTFQTNISMPEAIDFSPGSGYLGISNRSGNALLYRLKHYGNY